MQIMENSQKRNRIDLELQVHLETGTNSNDDVTESFMCDQNVNDNSFFPSFVVVENEVSNFRL